MSAASILFASARRRLGEARLLAISTAASVTAIGTFAAAAASPSVAEATAHNAGLAGLFSAASVVTAFFTALSGWFFAEHYLARRKREIATWLLVGMGKRRAFAMLSAEFAAAGLVAFLAGTGAGILLSRFFALLLAAVMRERSAIELPFGQTSIIAGGAACVLQFLLASARSLVAVGRTSIASLMRHEREAEAAPRAKPLRSVIGVALVLSGYAGALFAQGGMAVALILPVLFATVAGTFLCLEALVPTLAARARARALRPVRFRKGRTGHPARSAELLVATAQIAFRSRRNARLLALTAVLIAVAATASGTVIALYLGDSQITRRACPHSIELSDGDPARRAAVEEALRAAGATGLDALELEYLEAETTLEGGNVFSLSLFSHSAWSAATARIGEKAPEVAVSGFRPSLYFESLAPREGGKPLLIRSGSASVELLPEKGGFGPPVSVYGAANPVMISDEAWARLARDAGTEARRSITIWDGVETSVARAALPALRALGKPLPRVRVAVLAEQDAVNGALLFVGIFLAAVFILSSVSLVLFRVIEDTRDDRERYRVLEELGASRRVIARSLALQDLFSFGLPLGFGLLHCGFALVMMRHISGYESARPTALVAAFAVAAFAAAAALAVDRQLAASLPETDRP